MEGCQNVRIYLCGFNLNRILAGRRKTAGGQKKKQKAKSATERNPAGKKAEKQTMSELQPEKKKVEEQPFVEKPPVQEERGLSQAKTLTKETSYSRKKRKKQSYDSKKTFRGVWQRVKDFVYCIREFFSGVTSLWKKFRQKLDWAGDAKRFWKAPNTKRFICILKDNVIHLWRKLKPKVLRGSITFGTGDPCTTGEILGIAAMFYAVYGQGIQVTPDFEEAGLEGNLLIKGRFSLITIIMVLLRIFFSGEWSRFRKEAERLKEAF